MTVTVHANPIQQISSPGIYKKDAFLASVIVVNYNGRAYLFDCLQALLDTAGDETEIIVVDNGSSDGSFDEIGEFFPEIRLIRCPENLGYGGGNNAGARLARGQYLVFLNPDTTPTAGWLAALIGALESDPMAGLATSKILLSDRRERLNTAGNDIHLTGLTLCRGLGRPASALSEPSRVGAVSGAAFAIRRDLFERLGGFDESFFMYMEDSDLSLRAQVAGYYCLYTPQSVIYHYYELRFGPQKSYYQERNRYLMLLKAYRWRTLFLLLPALVLAEIVTWGYVLLHDGRNWRNKIRAYGYVMGHGRQIMVKRRETQLLRQVTDRELILRLVYRLDYGQASRGVAPSLARWFFDPFFKLWRRMMLAFMRW